MPSDDERHSRMSGKIPYFTDGGEARIQLGSDEVELLKLYRDMKPENQQRLRTLATFQHDLAGLIAKIQ